jgi:sulfoxide reductase heme-binding subunit YedZ
MITLLRHFLAIIVLLGLIFLFALNSNQESYTVHYWNRNIADASFVLLCLTLSLGPVTKLIPKTRFLLPWRRELGIAFAVSATMHVVIYADFYRWDVLRFFARIEEGQEAKWLDNAFAIGNWIGLLALLYAVVLALTSNDIAHWAEGGSSCNSRAIHYSCWSCSTLRS